MPTCKTVLLCLSLVAPVAVAQTGSIDLLSFAMPDAKIIAGANLDAAKSSTFGKFVLAQIQSGNPALQKFIQDTGVDPRTDIGEVLVASDGMPGPGVHGLVAAHGRFGTAIATLEAFARANGGTVTNVGAVDLIQVGQTLTNTSGQNACVALYTDGSTALIGDCDTLQAAIKSAAGAPPAGTSLLAKAALTRAQQDLWFTSALPLGQFANTVPTGFNAVLNSTLIQAIQQTSGGVKLTAASTSGVPSVQLSGDALMDTHDNATALKNVVTFFADMIQMNTNAVPAALQSLIGTLQTSVTESTLTVSMTIPESVLEQMFQQMHQQASTEASGVEELHHHRMVR